MAKQNKTLPIDFPILFFTLALIAFGLIMVISAGAVSGFNSKQNIYFYLFLQMKWTLVGFVFAAVVIKVPYTFWRKFAGVAILVSVALLIAVIFSDAGVAAKGSARWINILGVSIQPSEITKLALVLFYAHILDRYPVTRGKKWRIPLGVLLPVSILIFGLV